MGSILARWLGRDSSACSLVYASDNRVQGSCHYGTTDNVNDNCGSDDDDDDDYHDDDDTGPRAGNTAGIGSVL